MARSMKKSTSDSKTNNKTQEKPKSPVKRSSVDNETKYRCPFCDTLKTNDKFYASSDPNIKTGLTTMCKSCAEKIARNYDPVLNEFGECTKSSVMAALEYLDKPYFEDLWNTCYAEVHDINKRNVNSNLWSMYMRNISLIKYRMMRWRDGDLYDTYKERIIKQLGMVEPNKEDVFKNDEILESYKQNRTDVIRLLGYDPFENEDELSKPLLYSQLIGYLDLGGDNDDMMRTSSAITIVRGFLQQSKLDDRIAKAMENITADGRVGEIKSLLDAKQKLSSNISQLAEQSCLSLKHSKNASKGENTWTGKIKKIKELDLREGEVNGFDINTCRGMQQVVEISDASIMKQLRLDESEWSDMVAEQRKMLVDTQKERDIYKELNRLLLKENVDLRDTLKENELLNEGDLQDLRELFSPLSEITTNEDIEDEDEELDENDEVSNNAD